MQAQHRPACNARGKVPALVLSTTHQHWCGPVHAGAPRLHSCSAGPPTPCNNPNPWLSEVLLSLPPKVETDCQGTDYLTGFLGLPNFLRTRPHSEFCYVHSTVLSLQTKRSRFFQLCPCPEHTLVPRKGTGTQAPGRKGLYWAQAQEPGSMRNAGLFVQGQPTFGAAPGIHCRVPETVCPFLFPSVRDEAAGLANAC